MYEKIRKYVETRVDTMTISKIVCGPYAVTFLNGTCKIEWYMARHVVKNR